MEYLKLYEKFENSISDYLIEFVDNGICTCFSNEYCEIAVFRNYLSNDIVRAINRLKSFKIRYETFNAKYVTYIIDISDEIVNYLNYICSDMIQYKNTQNSYKTIFFGKSKSRILFKYNPNTKYVFFKTHIINNIVDKFKCDERLSIIILEYYCHKYIKLDISCGFDWHIDRLEGRTKLVEL